MLNNLTEQELYAKIVEDWQVCLAAVEAMKQLKLIEENDSPPVEEVEKFIADHSGALCHYGFTEWVKTEVDSILKEKEFLGLRLAGFVDISTLADALIETDALVVVELNGKEFVFLT